MKTNYLLLDKISSCNLEDLDITQKYNFEIYSKANIRVLETLNLFFKENKTSRLTFNCEIATDSRVADFAYNLEILKYVPEANNVVLYPKTLKTDLSSIQLLENLYELNSLTIKGVFKNNIPLDTLVNFSHSLQFFEIEKGLTKKQQNIINQLINIKTLKTKELDLNTFDIKEKLYELYIETNLFGMNQISFKFPLLDKLFLKNCKSSLDISSIDAITSLTRLSLFEVYAIEKFPQFLHLEKLTELDLIMPNLKNINNLWSLTSLKELSIMNLNYLKPKNFKNLQNLTNLKKAYITFKDKENNQLIRSFIENEGLEYKM